MKKRNVMTMALSLAMVGVIGVGSTLAYLTATDNSVTNTFEFANNMTVKLWEDPPAKVLDESIGGNTESGWNYTNVTPGQTLNKAPEFSVTTSVDAYVFARVTESSNVTVQDYKTGEGEWTKLTGVDDVVYYKQVTGAADEQPLGELFTKVTAGEESDLAGTPLNPITIEVAAIQVSGFDTVQEAYAAADFQE